MLSSCFFLIGIGFICKKNFRKTFQRLIGRISRCFCDQLTFSITQVLTHFLEFLKSARKCFHFFRWNDRPMSADSEKPNIIGGNWTKYCTVAKSVGRGRPIWTPVVVRARASLALCGRFNQFQSPYSWITMRRALRKRRVFDFVPSYLNTGLFGKKKKGNVKNHTPQGYDRWSNYKTRQKKKKKQKKNSKGTCCYESTHTCMPPANFFSSGWVWRSSGMHGLLHISQMLSNFVHWQNHQFTFKNVCDSACVHTLLFTPFCHPVQSFCG